MSEPDARKCPKCGNRLMFAKGVTEFFPDEFPYSEERSLKEEEELDDDFSFSEQVLVHYCEKCEEIKHAWVEY